MSAVVALWDAVDGPIEVVWEDADADGVWCVDVGPDGTAYTYFSRPSWSPERPQWLTTDELPRHRQRRAR